MFKPWISKEILQKCQNRDSILKGISRENDPVKKSNLRNDYKKLRNEITKDKRESKKTYFISYFEKNRHKSSEIWKGIRTLVNLKPSKSFNIKLLFFLQLFSCDEQLYKSYFLSVCVSVCPCLRDGNVHKTSAFQ